MMKQMTKIKQGSLALLALVVVSLAVISLPASALDLDQARSQGMVKETSSGYLKVAKPSAEVNALVKKVNAGRKAEYQKIAKKNGTSIQAVEQLAGKRLAK